MHLRSVIACGGLAPLLIAAAQPVRLQPSGPWIVDYAENSCRLGRTFGEGNSKTTLEFESEAPGAADMLVAGKPLRTSQERVSALFLPVGGKPFDGKVGQTVAGSDPAIVWGHVEMMPDDLRKRLEDEAKHYHDTGVRPPAVSIAEQTERNRQRQQFAAAATELEFQTSRDRTVVLETGSLGDAMKAFDECSRDSLKDWGVDPAVDAQIVRRAWTVNPTAWLSSMDYPVELVRRGEESQFTVRLLVDASGKVTKCTSLSHYNEPEFNRITCDRIMERARFEPAELADGTKVPSYFVQRVEFRLAP
jgi:TonB family protein